MRLLSLKVKLSGSFFEKRSESRKEVYGKEWGLKACSYLAKATEFRMSSQDNHC